MTDLKIEFISKNRIEATERFAAIIDKVYKDAPKDLAKLIVGKIDDDHINQISDLHFNEKLLLNTAFAILPQSIFCTDEEESFSLVVNPKKDGIYNIGYYYNGIVWLFSNQDTKIKSILELAWLFIIEPSIQRFSE